MINPSVFSHFDEFRCVSKAEDRPGVGVAPPPRRVGEKWQFDGARMRAVELPLRSPAAQAGG